ncbi:MAG: repeat containing protein, partial [Bryobacterales bacterium]|nr:repeat containing protein [Bryobacterales bacterium]
WGNTHGVVEDSQGQIYVHHTVNKSSQSADTMVVFDSKGKFVRSWGKEFRGVAHGLSIRKEGPTEYLYLSVNATNPRLAPQPDLSAVIIKATTKGEIVWKIAGPPDIAEYKPGADGQPKRYNPTNLAVAPNGDIYVGDGYGSSYVNQYDAKGTYIRTFGGRGAEAGKLAEPHGIWMDLRGKTPVLTVADRGNARLQRFTLDGKHIDFVNGVTKPCHFDEHKGDLVIPDLQGKVTLMDKDNKVITHLGDFGAASMNDLNPIRVKTRENFTPGKFVCPHGACFDHKGNIFVVEWVEVGRVTKLRKV